MKKNTKGRFTLIALQIIRDILNFATKKKRRKKTSYRRFQNLRFET